MSKLPNYELPKIVQLEKIQAIKNQHRLISHLSCMDSLKLFVLKIITSKSGCGSIPPMLTLPKIFKTQIKLLVILVGQMCVPGRRVCPFQAHSHILNQGRKFESPNEILKTIMFSLSQINCFKVETNRDRFQKHLF